MLNKQIAEYKDFGKIVIKLDQILTKRGITTYELSNKTDIRFQTIKKIREADEVTRIGLDVLAKICFVLDCKLEDIIEYKK